jgi:hypothetical protein
MAGLGGIFDEGTGETHPFLHPATEFSWKPILHALQPHSLEGKVDPFTNLALTEATAAVKKEAHVLPNGEGSEEGRILEHQPHIGGVALVQSEIGLGFPMELHHTRGGKKQPRHQPENGGLSRTGGTHHHQALSRLHQEAELIKDQVLPPSHGDLRKFHHRRNAGIGEHSRGRLQRTRDQTTHPS